MASRVNRKYRHPHNVACEALERAQSSPALTNYPAIFAGFMARGLAEADIVPRVNVLTYHAWRAKGRQVRKGEHGVRVLTYLPIERTAYTADGTVRKVPGVRPKVAIVFHVSQTDEVKP